MTDFYPLFALNSRVYQILVEVQFESGINVLGLINFYDHGNGCFTVECWFSISYSPDRYGWFNWGHSSGQPTENDGKYFLTAMPAMS